MADTDIKKKNKNPNVGKKIRAVPKPKPEIGVDLTNSFQDIILDAVTNSTLDTSRIEAFTRVAQTRENVYGTIDAMSQDSTLAAVLETYAEDVTETNDRGEIMWCESDDSDVSNYVSYLLNSLRIDKNLYSWAIKLIKYGDIYTRLYRESDYKEDLLFGYTEEEKKEILNEDIKINVNDAADHYVHYVELYDNPSEMFDLTKFGKTMAFIKAPISIQTSYTGDGLTSYNYLTYNLKQRDIVVYSSKDFVHACLEDNSSRIPEEVNITIDQDENGKIKSSNLYKVKRGQSLFNDVFKTWRQLSLLENSILLNRLTKSAITRILNVEVGDMPKEQVQSFIQRLKSKIEQKSSIDVNNSLTEYPNAGPIDNIIYIPTHGSQGSISAQTLGGDVDPKQLTDVSYFQDKLFGSLRVPKQFFGITDDSAGFNGGTSLSIISSRYGKAVKRIQNIMCQMVTDIVNLFLLDKGLDSYVNRFKLRMQAPVTQEELDKRANNDNRIRYVGDIMDKLNDIPDQSAKLKILKILLANIINDPDVLAILDQQIAKLEEQENPDSDKNNSNNENKNNSNSEEDNFDINSELPRFESDETEEESSEEYPEEQNIESAEEVDTFESDTESENSYMPSPAELDIDMTQNQ